MHAFKINLKLKLYLNFKIFVRNVAILTAFMANMSSGKVPVKALNTGKKNLV